MKISKETQSIMKSLSGINTGMVVPIGSMIQSESEPKDIFCNCNVTETFDVEFAIYDLPKFLNILAMFDDSELTFNKEFVNIQSGRNQIDYFYTDKSFITHGDFLDIADDKYVIEFDLTEEDINNIQKISSIMSLDQLEFTNHEGKLVCDVVSKSGDTNDRYGVEMGACADTNDFKFVMRVGENFRFYAGDYEIKIAKIGEVLVFCANAKNNSLKYQIALDRKSYYKD